MHRPRLIPCLLLDGLRLVKTTKFTNPLYVGDPINTIKIFNEKEADELIVLDIAASKSGAGPNFAYLESLASECFMPICYGGGVKTLQDAERLIGCGIEKISINSSALMNLKLVDDIAKRYGSQSVVVSIDFKQHWFKGCRVWNSATASLTKYTPAEWAKIVTDAGAGEILVNSVDRDGTLSGYDLDAVRSVTQTVTVPVIACGGASSLENCRTVISAAGAAAAAAGALFVYKGPHRAVLINYPDPTQLYGLFQ